MIFKENKADDLKKRHLDFFHFFFPFGMRNWDSVVELLTLKLENTDNEAS